MTKEPPHFEPAEITLPFADGEYLFRMPLPIIAELQQKRGWAATFPDGSQYKRPKPLGLIWKELASTGEYDPEDCVAIIHLALIGGNSGLVAGEPIQVPRVKADQLVRDYVANEQRLVMPAEEIWQMAAQVLMATCQGFAPPKDQVKDETDPQPEAAADISTSPPL